jgi:hypothetical protein
LGSREIHMRWLFRVALLVVVGTLAWKSWGDCVYLINTETERLPFIEMKLEGGWPPIQNTTSDIGHHRLDGGIA